jgi:membrane associated rhomboid family serine protease
LLGYEIVSLTLLGALGALFGTLGLYWIFDDANRDRKPAGVLLAAVCLPLTLTLYG